jgi:hypothetical protein
VQEFGPEIAHEGGVIKLSNSFIGKLEGGGADQEQKDSCKSFAL